MNNELRIIISGGGTGGHIFPAVSIANAIKAKRPDAKILFVGALGRMEIDELGLDLIDRLLLTSMIKNYNGGPVGLETIAATIGEEAVTIEDVYEPYLMQIGFLSKTPRGRVVTVKAYEHLKLPMNG